jgi:DNA invertase Pin-like site-specific DNA recombinase
MIKAFSYLRMSTNEQLKKGDSYRRQTEATLNYCKNNNLELIESIEDLGKSAFKNNHIKDKDGGLGLFIQALEENKIEEGSVLIVEHLDRLSRITPSKAMAQFTKILSYGITIITLNDGQQYTQESLDSNIGQLFMSIGAMFAAHQESLKKSTRLKESWINKRNKAKDLPLTSIAPAWITFKESSGKFELNDLSISIKKIFELSIEGMGSLTIANYLNEHNYPVLNSTWNRSYIEKILSNIACYGAYELHKMIDGKRVKTGEIIEDYFPKVIEQDVFNVCRFKRSSRNVSGSNGGRQGLNFSNLFTKIIKCHCGATMVYRDTGKRGSKFLICGRYSTKQCDSFAWDYTDFETRFFKFIHDVSLNDTDNNSSKITEIQTKIDLSTIAKSNLLKEFNNLIESLSIAPIDLHQSIFKLSSKKQDDIKQIDKEILEFNNEINELQIKPDHIKSDILELLKSNPDKDTRQAIHYKIKAIVERIVINPGIEYIAGDDIDSMIPDNVLKIIRKRRNNTIEQIEGYLLSKQGKVLLNEYTRSYIVYFKDGIIKTVSYEGLILDSTRIKQLMNHRDKQ